jgi:hypothetical protein
MNLSINPSQNDLALLLARVDDDAGHHIIWVAHNGEVHIDTLPEEMTPPEFATKNKEIIKFRLETCDQGNGYTGLSAADDKQWVEILFNGLITNWENNATGYIDAF